MNMEATERKIDALMAEHHIMGGIVEEREDIKMVGVEVIWGDWKHEHLKLDWLMEENFSDLRNICTVTTEDNETDCYSAIHYYYFN